MLVTLIVKSIAEWERTKYYEAFLGNLSINQGCFWIIFNGAVLEITCSSTKNQLDATLCRFYFCRVTLHVSGVNRPSSGVFKTGTAATGTCVIVAGKSSHHLIRALIRWCDVPVLNTPDDGRLRPKRVEWLCRNKTCTVLHQVGF